MHESPDPYTYPETNVLRNLLDIRDPGALDAFEADAATHRLAELHERPFGGRFDVAHLKAIHRHIFQDVYDWAGEFRTVDLSKDGHLFGRPPYLEPALQELFGNLAGEAFLRQTFLRQTSGVGFAKRGGFYFAELNAAHPFREGNGRAQREFVRELALQAGFTIDWRQTSQREMIAASRESFVTGDSARVVAILQSCLGVTAD
jgi:cell filamentation protein